jgi:hypothetical protein
MKDDRYLHQTGELVRFHRLARQPGQSRQSAPTRHRRSPENALFRQCSLDARYSIHRPTMANKAAPPCHETTGQKAIAAV